MNHSADDSSPIRDDRDCTEAADYVNQLIARMNGEEEPAEDEQLLLPAAAPKVQSPLATTQWKRTEGTDPGAPPRRREPQRPIVMAADLQRMREAVNLSTNRAFESLDTITLFRAVYTYIVVAVILMATSLVLISMCREVRSAAYFASVIAAIVAGLATWKYIQNVSKLSQTLAKSSRVSREIPAL